MIGDANKGNSYDSPDDSYILKGGLSICTTRCNYFPLTLWPGSCGVEYRLALTDYGYEKYGSATWTNRFTNDNSTSSMLPPPTLPLNSLLMPAPQQT